MGNDKVAISLSQHLEDQANAKSAFLATVEAHGDAKVKVTPWREGSGCLCAYAFVVPASAIAHVTRTGEVHACCDKRLAVVEVEFADKHKAIADVVSQQLAAAARDASIPYRDEPPYTNYACESRCVNNLVSCNHHCRGNLACQAQCARIFAPCWRNCSYPVDRL
jgi:hypothetical protein